MKFVLFDFHLPFLFLLSLCLFPLVIANDMNKGVIFSLVPM